MDEQICPKCKTTRYRNPSMKMMVNVCGHDLCDSCVELLFVKGSGNCPDCGLSLRRVNFRIKLFDDASVDKEVEIRRRILRDFNKKENDFPDLRSYNDYLEMIEDIIFNLSNDIQILETNKRIAEYKDQNKDFINRNRHKVSIESMEIEDILLAESKQSDLKKKEDAINEKNKKMAKIRDKEKLIDELMFSDSDANSIVEGFNKTSVESSGQPKLFSTGISSVATSGLVTDMPIYKNEPYIYSELSLVFNGPQPPKNEEEISEFIAHVRSAGPSELAAGFKESVACFRALQEAMSGLYYSYSKS